MSLALEGASECVGVGVGCWSPVRVVCPNYEVVEFQPRKVTPPEPRRCCLLLRIYTCTAPLLPTFPPPDVLTGGAAPY